MRDLTPPLPRAHNWPLCSLSGLVLVLVLVLVHVLVLVLLLVLVNGN
jgi:hypothetical protein